MASSFSALVHWPNAPLSESLVRNALRELNISYTESAKGPTPLLQWATYESIDHERGLTEPKSVLSSSYTFRKALIRKHFLSRVTHSYVTKNTDSVLKKAVPTTYELELSFADELDEMWMDDLWALGQRLDDSDSWWILKPGMADRGMGIRMFNSKDQLQQIFEGFESDDESENGEQESTAVIMSQLRHFVVQEYIPNPLLFDPREISLDGSPMQAPVEGHKFHLRVYCVASGALKVYAYTRILALFAPIPYANPKTPDGDGLLDLGPHLTNTCLQTDLGEEYVRLFSELVGCHIMSNENRVFLEEDLENIINQISKVLGDTFKAAVDSPVHFQPLPNAFELFGVDFLVADTGDASNRFQVELLEMNAEPAIDQTGPRLTWILEDLFQEIARTCVVPFFSPDEKVDWAVGETRAHFRKCLDIQTRSWD